jgi:hypothetical protein
MKKSHLVVPAFLVVAGLTTQPSIIAVDSTRAKQWGDVVNGCHIRVTPENRKVAAGEALDAEIEIGNVGDQKATYYLDGYQFEEDYLIIEGSRDDGLKLKATQYAMQPIVSRSTVPEVVIKAGENKRFAIRLNRLVDLTIAGNYTLFVKFRVQIGNEEKILDAPGFNVEIFSPREKMTSR